VFTLCIGAAGCALVVMSLLQDFVGAATASVVMGLFAGIAWITGFTMIGHEVSDRLRGRVFAFVMSSVRLTLLGTIAAGPILANSIGFHLLSVGTFRMVLSGPAIVLAVSGVLTVAVSVFAGRQVGGFRGERMRRVLRRLLQRPRGELLDATESLPGVLVAVVGADAVATDRYARVLADHLQASGWHMQVVVAGTGTGPSDTAAGVLMEASGEPTPGDAAPADQAPDQPEDTPATALRAMADLADLVSGRVRPLLEAGAVVVCCDYVDAAVVRYGAQAGLSEERILRLANWATGGIVPDLTLLVDPLGDGVFARNGQPDGADATPEAAGGDGASGDDGGDGAGGGAAPTGEPAGSGGAQSDSTGDDRDAGGRAGAGDGAGAGADAGDDAGAGDVDEEEPVDPRRVYQDLAASAPERYIAVPPLAEGEPIPQDVAERVASTLAGRSPAKRADAPAGDAEPEADPDTAAGKPVTAAGSRSGDAGEPGPPAADRSLADRPA
jgi:dTMP kinase